MNTRDPVGFIVEGHGEYNCYPSLFCRIVSTHGICVPRINAGGCGSIVRRLKEHLTDLLLAHSPLTVIVTVDLEDVLKQELARSCIELLEILNAVVVEWRENALTDARLHPLPNHIVCIVQIKKFESWLISDVDGLKEAGLLDVGVITEQDAEQVASPSSWLSDHLLADGCVKNPNVAKKVISALRPERMRNHSKSFDKFYRESVRAYEAWENFVE